MHVGYKFRGGPFVHKLKKAGLYQIAVEPDHAMDSLPEPDTEETLELLFESFRSRSMQFGGSLTGSNPRRRQLREQLVSAKSRS